MTLLGSAAAGAAGALGEAGVGHATSKGKRRASSARRAAEKRHEDRSRSPGTPRADIRTAVAERAINAPIYVEPGADGDELGIEGRHRNNMQNMFGFMAHVQKVLNGHAGLIDGGDFELRSSKRAAREQALDIKSLSNRRRWDRWRKKSAVSRLYYYFELLLIHLDE